MKLAIFGMFRSGTNYLWHLLSKDKRFKYCYTEPLHPYLLDQRREYKHYSLYNELEDLEKYFNWNLTFHKYVMDVEEENDRLKSYLSYLIKEDTLIKINRMPFRIGWFKKNFPEVKCAGIIRDPRAYAYAHVLNGGEWDSIFFDLCLEEERFHNYLEPFWNEHSLVKLLAFWKICAEEMKKHIYLITIEGLNLNRSFTLSNLYRSVHIEHFQEHLDFMKPDKDSYFWGDSTKYYTDISRNFWSEAIEKTGIKDLMVQFGYSEI